MNKYIEFTQLGNLNRKQLNNVIDFANESKPRALVIKAGWTSVAKRNLAKDIKVVTVGGYPFDDLDNALDLSADADEFDMVIPIMEYYKNNNLLLVADSITKARKKLGKKILKVIMETNFMFNKRYAITELVKCIEDCGADVVKTNTGINTFQFTAADKKQLRKFSDLIEDVEIIKSITDLPIKAAGGIRTNQQAKQLIDLGVKYIGTSGRHWV